MKLSLNLQILIGAVIGVAGGIWLSTLSKESTVSFWAFYVCDILGGTFINLLKMILIPLVFTSIIVGLVNLRAHQPMKRVWVTTLVFFLFTAVLAATLGLTAINIFKPGAGLEMNIFKDALSNYTAPNLSFSQFFQTFLANLFLNPFAAMAQGNVLATDRKSVV